MESSTDRTTIFNLEHAHERFGQRFIIDIVEDRPRRNAIAAVDVEVASCGLKLILVWHVGASNVGRASAVNRDATRLSGAAALAIRRSLTHGNGPRVTNRGNHP